MASVETLLPHSGQVINAMHSLDEFVDRVARDVALEHARSQQTNSGHDTTDSEELANTTPRRLRTCL